MSVKKGNYYRRKTKQLFNELGYETEYLETYQTVFKPGQVIHSKRDLFGADGISINKNEVIFWNSVVGRKSISSHKKRFKQHNFPDSPAIKCCLVIWQPYKKPELMYI